jgi:hypothetical protein
LSACVGEDLVDDQVPTEIRITNPILSLEIEQTHQYQAKYFDFVGREISEKPLVWESSDPAVASVSHQGLVTAIGEGSAVITVTSEDDLGNVISATDKLEVSDNTQTENMIITGTLQTTSSYLLRGSFRLEKTEASFTLYLEDDYQADRGLPRLVVFLSNNRNSVADAYRVGEVRVFSGAHSYDLPSEFGLMDYRYLLYWCEPFNVDVGEGILIP